MFSAGDSQAGELGAEAAPANDDLLGHVRGSAANPSLRRGAGRAATPQDGATEPDILDMFGVPPAKPEGKEAK